MPHRMVTIRPVNREDRLVTFLNKGMHEFRKHNCISGKSVGRNLIFFCRRSTPEREVPEPDFRSRGTRRSSERINGAPDRSPGRSPGRTTRKSVNRETEVRKSSGRERTPPTTENGSPMAVRKLTPGRRVSACNSYIRRL